MSRGLVQGEHRQIPAAFGVSGTHLHVVIAPTAVRCIDAPSRNEGPIQARLGRLRHLPVKRNQGWR